MPLHNYYAEQCRSLAQELVESLDEAQVDQLRELLDSIGGRQWRRWREAHAERVASFVSATPSARKKRRHPVNDHLLLTLAAYQHCCEAADFLTAASRLQSDASYRQMAAEAGLARRTLEEEEWPDWPWPEPDPFDDPEFWRRGSGAPPDVSAS